MDLLRVLRGPAVGIALFIATLWVADTVWAGHSPLLVGSVAVALFSGTIAVNGQLSKAPSAAVNQTNNGTVGDHAFGNVHVAGDAYFNLAGGHGSSLRETARVIRMGEADRAFELFINHSDKAYILWLLIEEGGYRRATDLIYWMGSQFPGPAAKLLSTEGGRWVLAALLPQVLPPGLHQLVRVLSKDQLTELLKTLPADVAALVLADIYAEDPDLGNGLLHAVPPQQVAELLTAAVTGSVLTKAVADLDWRTRRNILSWLESDDPIAIAIRRVVTARWQWRLGASACIAAVLVAIVVWVATLNDDQAGPAPRAAPSSHRTTNQAVSPKVPPSGFPETPRLAEYQPRWSDVCTKWRSDDTADRLVDVCEMAVSGQRYQVVYVQYPLDEVPFERGDPPGPTTADCWGPDGRMGRYQFYWHEDTGWSAWLQEDDQTRVALLFHSYRRDQGAKPKAATEKLLQAILRSHGYRVE